MSPLQPGASPGFLLWRVGLGWQRVMTATLKPLGLTHVQFVLLASSWWFATANAQAPTQRQLADFAATDPMMTSQVLRALEQRGLVERPTDPIDARARRVVVTSAGAALARRSLRRVEAADAEFFAGTLHVPFLSALNQLETRRAM